MSDLHEQLQEVKHRAYLATPAPEEKFIPKEMLRRSQADVPALIALVEPLVGILWHAELTDVDLTEMAKGCVCDVCNLIIGVGRAHQEATS